MAKVAGIARAPRPREPMEELAQSKITVEEGLDGDRRGRQEGRQITLLSKEAWEAACSESGGLLAWTTRRANILISDVDFDQAMGQDIWIGDVHLKVTEETEPCSLMEEAQSGLRARMSVNWRGGVRCAVLSGGTINVGDDVRIESRS